MRTDVTSLVDSLEFMRQEVDASLHELIQNEINSGAGQVAQEAGRVLLAGGKRLRPLLILLAHRLAGGSCLLYTSPSPRDGLLSRMPSSA